MRRQTRYVPLAVLMLAPCMLHAQASYTASRRMVQAGVGWSYVKPDYSNLHAQGVYAFATAELFKRTSVDVDIHIDSLITPTDVGENTFMIGPRYDVLKRHAFRAYIKAEGGIGQFEFQPGKYANPSSSLNGVIGFGGGVDVRASRHINVRAIDIQAQRWPKFVPNGLSPVVYSFGIAFIP